MVKTCKCLGVWKVMCKCLGVWKVMCKCLGVWKVRGKYGGGGGGGGIEVGQVGAQVYHDCYHHLDHDLAHHLDHDLDDQLSLYLEWAVYVVEWMTSEV